jgi:hypothetical protein
VTDASVLSQELPGCGLELVSPILKGQEGMEQLKKVCQAMKMAGARINKTCGLHVHHDAQDFETAEFKNLIKIYIRFESVIDSLVSKSRRENNNRYCRGLSHINIKDVTKATEYFQLYNLLESRYRKLNIFSYATHGTVEFRQHQGTIEYEKIANWVKLTQAMVERAAARTVNEGKTNTWEHFKTYVFEARNADGSYTTARSAETRGMLTYFDKRRKALAA